MAIGERIHFFRLRNNLTMNGLGQLLGFEKKGADVRIAQYENNSRKPKADLTKAMAEIFGVVPESLAVPDIDTYIGLIHTMFTLEDVYGLSVDTIDGTVCLRLEKSITQPGSVLWTMLDDWAAMKAKLNAREISKEEYDRWRYNYSLNSSTVHSAKVPSQTLSNELASALKTDEQ